MPAALRFPGRIEVEHRLYRVERGERHLHEDGDPVRHRAVPEARQFHRAKRAPLVGFRGDEPRFGIHVLRQVEIAALERAGAAHHVHRIEVRGPLRDGLLLRIILVDLR